VVQVIALVPWLIRVDPEHRLVESFETALHYHA
jgi:hypothetical protein